MVKRGFFLPYLTPSNLLRIVTSQLILLFMLVEQRLIARLKSSGHLSRIFIVYHHIRSDGWLDNYWTLTGVLGGVAVFWDDFTG